MASTGTEPAVLEMPVYGYCSMQHLLQTLIMASTSAEPAGDRDASLWILFYATPSPDVAPSISNNLTCVCN
ncbi:conserved hypothetical protein [Ricinus communis]|uniref:Uncharacterized protein n=1 Tax=Ricinus communis TaxID=3988 RepID=B9RCA8_RICCO|nr:conserved hypothetical protein [Ricinus communis]